MAATSYSSDPTLYLYTSLTAGSSHIITATSRLETILKANKIPFRALDCATDEKARMLWGRRSKGRKLPGLVKYGEIIGDLEQIEEWNEYGELKDQIAATQDFGSFTTGTAAATKLAPEMPGASTASTPQRSGPPSRASSETRHISITEPKERKDGDGKSGSLQKPADTPVNIAMRQLGAEAAAKAAQKKTGAAASQPLKAAAAPVTERSIPDQTPSSAAAKLSTEEAVTSADTAAEVTAAKTPAQLASEGAGRTSIDKIAESEDKLASGAAEMEQQPKSTEEQQLEMRRTSSVTKSKSRLSDVTPIAESDSIVAEPEESVKSPSPVAVPEGEVSARPADMPRQHRGSDIGQASLEEIKALEKKMSIPEEGDAGDDNVTSTTTKVPAVSTTDKAEEKATKGIETQKTEPKDADKAGVSVGD
ncbi:hypothetical protein A1O7_09380 [Cladophialophora yegresii CBS 114405]|uniref:Glutaredoxin domain-containing protein n=1 Tax=Cladophialophora yegresii CBS 114405 TaxID=1182544 RepID=W9VEZ6_9EURO|nr:uncharacterized protein A1O7_09380 [Cladophialophora yegresii CBS 114405]EXJ54043.1 hypothetical protein A1O7_09380 [Cladophialophora yegresii CBS 114405]